MIAPTVPLAPAVAAFAVAAASRLLAGASVVRVTLPDNGSDGALSAGTWEDGALDDVPRRER